MIAKLRAELSSLYQQRADALKLELEAPTCLKQLTTLRQYSTLPTDERASETQSNIVSGYLEAPGKQAECEAISTDEHSRDETTLLEEQSLAEGEAIPRKRADIETIQDLHDQISRLQDQERANSQEHARLTAETERLTVDLTTSEKKLKEWIFYGRGCRTKYDELAAEMKLLEETKPKVRNPNSQANASTKELQSQIDFLTTELSTCRETIKDLESLNTSHTR